MSYRLHCVRTRGFNHTGPRRGEVFVTSNLARQIAEIEKGLREPVVWVGNLEAVRDFTDVRDMVRTYWLTIERGARSTISARGGATRSATCSRCCLAQVKVEVREDPARLRPSDIQILLGDCSRFRQVSGWQPLIPLDVTLKDLLDYWRQRV